MNLLPALRTGATLLSRLCLVGFLLATRHLLALDPTLTVGQYAHSVWTRDSGSLSSGVRALAQTVDGRLWIGTDTGLEQFDGVRFHPWKPPSNQQLPGEFIMALTADPDGGLWIGTREGLSRWNGSALHNFRSSGGPAGARISTILVDTIGRVWVGTAGFTGGALCRVESDMLRCHGAADGLPVFGVLSLFEDRGGELWVGGRGLARWKPGMPAAHPVLDPQDEVVSIGQDGEGPVWVSSGGVRRLDRDRAVSYAGLPAGEASGPIALLTDSDGALWIGTQGQGLIHAYRGHVDRYTHVDGLSSDLIVSLLEDHEHNIWVGTEGGLDQFHELTVTTAAKGERSSSGPLSSILAANDGSLWAGAYAGLHRIENGKLVPYGKQLGLPAGAVTAIFQEQGGRMWASTDAGLEYSDGGRFNLLKLPFAVGRLVFASAAEDGDHNVWLSIPERGLVELQDASLAAVIPWSQFGGRQAWALEPDSRDGGIWLGFAQGGIAHYKAGQPIRWFSTSGSLAHEAVVDLRQTNDGTLWIATQRGLGRLLNGRLDTITHANGLPCERIHSILEDDHHALWLSSGCGLMRIPSVEGSKLWANPSAKIAVKLYDAIDGIRSWQKPIGYFRRAAKSADGRLWFLVLDSVAVVDPKRLPENRIPPPVRIEELTAGHTSYGVLDGLRLPALTKELRIDFTAMSFVVPARVRFRYKLEGFDSEWNDDRSLRQAVYTNLPPRHYRFRVVACNNDGLWNNDGATVDFSIAPAYYQTLWFDCLVGLGVGLAVWSMYRLRLRQADAAMRRIYNERLAERNSIAQEMHDTLLQSICGVSLQLGAIAKAAELPSPTKDRLDDVRKQNDQCMREAREFLWELRAPTLEEQDLPEALSAAGEEIVSGAAVEFETTVDGRRRPASGDLRRQLTRIVQEGARNAVRYSHANKIELHITYLDADAIRVQLRDDGCGFDVRDESLQVEHWGLKTMKERARQIGGELKISSSPGCGTELEIVAPMNSTRRSQ